MPGGAVASGTVSRVDPRTSFEIRRNERRRRDRIGGEEGVSERVRLPRDRVRLILVGDALRQSRGPLLQRGRSRHPRQVVDPRAYCCCKLAHFGIFGGAYDPAVGDRSSIIIGEIVENLPSLRRLLYGCGRMFTGALGLRAGGGFRGPSTPNAYDNEKRSHL
jgi:hypothetical protein